MICHTEDVKAGEVVSADICVIGSGPAAFAFALQFTEGAPASKPFKVVMLESQPMQTNIQRALAVGQGVHCDVQALLYPGELAGLLPGRSDNYLCCGPWAGRLREYGGTANHWGGWNWPLEAHDLGGRPFHRGSEWPLTMDDLRPWYKHVFSDVMKLNNQEFDNPDYWVRVYSGLGAIPLSTGSPLKTRILQFNGIRFGEIFGPRVEQSPYVDLRFNANALEFETVVEGGSRRATRLRVGSLNETCGVEKSWYVEAARYVVCAGAIESTRLLLLNGLGDQGGQLGRWFMDHPYMNQMVSFKVTDSLPGDVERFYFNRSPLPGGPPNNSTFIAGLVPSDTWLSDNPGLGDFRILLGSQGGSVRGTWVNIEPQPDPNSRITLTDETDLFGQRRAKVDWKSLIEAGRNADTETLRATIEVARKVLVDEFGYVDGWAVADPNWVTSDWPEWKRDGSFAVAPGLHPMGSTRMSTDPADGVVDPQLRVHDTANVYVSASSVFPTAGYQNPTFTVCALSARLAHNFIGEAG